MPADVLTTLALSPLDTVHLSSNLRSRLLNFLLRWEQYAAAAACLDQLIPVNPALVSLLDARARAQRGQGNPDVALATMAIRHQRKISMTSRVLEARFHLAGGDASAAYRIALALSLEKPTSPTVWGLVGEVHLAQGDLEAAEKAYRRQLGISRRGSAALLGLMDVYRARGDWVSAGAYAVRAQTVDPDRTPPAAALRRLLDFYQAAGDPNRAADAQAALSQRYNAQVADLETALSAELSRISAPLPPSTLPKEHPRPPISLPKEHLPPLTPAERTRIEAAARQHFNFGRLLPGQAEIMAPVLRGEDVLAVLPTGGGKSLCYQLPALLDQAGATLVISPLIALMKDQLDSLPPAARKLATTINSSLGGDELRRRMRAVAGGRYRLVYAAPERLRQPPFLYALQRGGLARLVIDEAHCVSLWGHDFRPDYLFIPQARRALGNPPLLAMTATAPERVRRDIIRRMGELQVVATGVQRPNLRLEVIHARNADEKLRHLLTICQAESGSGIVYAGTRARCESLAALLRRQGVDAIHYHAGIPNRSAVQDRFMTGRVRVVVATVAFGLGIDKSDIRFIIHHVPPQSLEAYYQEAGRAGRDGRPARCILFFSPSDKATLTRRARGDGQPVEFLRFVYRALQGRLGGEPVGRVATDDLCRDVRAEETSIRVALSLLETAGLLLRHFDVPRTALVTLYHYNAEHDCRAFCEAARLRPGQRLEVDLILAARTAGLDPTTIERCVLAWAGAGLMEYRPAGRDLLLELLPPPPDAAGLVANLLDRYATMQVQRVEEITAYARTRRCRHGHIGAYLGSTGKGPLTSCGACDNCLGLKSQPAAAPPPLSKEEQLRAVLECVAGTRQGIGPASLARALRAESRAPEWTRGLPGYGTLSFRSQAAVKQLVDGLVGDNLLQARQLGHGGTLLMLTLAGREAVKVHQHL